jgi:hypothetical protein
MKTLAGHVPFAFDQITPVLPLVTHAKLKIEQ